MKTFYEIKAGTSKAQDTFGMIRLAVKGAPTKLVEVGFGYDMVGALVLKFLKATYTDKAEIWATVNPMMGINTIQKLAKSTGVDLELVYTKTGKLAGFEV